MRKRLSLIPLVFLLCSAAFPHSQNSLETSDSDSLGLATEVEASDSVSMIDSEGITEEGRFSEEIASRFSLGNVITSEDIENSAAERVGGLLEMRSLVDVVGGGSWWQPEMASFGGNIRGINIFIDGNAYKQQDLYFPQQGYLDLNSLCLSNISRMELLPLGLTGLRGGGLGALGIDFVTRDFDGIEPHSEAATSRGPDGTYRTRVELGRRITSRAKFDLTAELRKSEGRLVNSDYDGLFLGGKTTINVDRRMHLRVTGYQYRTRMGLPLFPDADSRDARKKVDNRGAAGSLIMQREESSSLTVSLRYDRQNQEVKSAGYGFENKKIEDTFGLTATHTRRFGGRHHVKIEGQAERKSLESLTAKNAAHGGRLSITDLIEMRSTTTLLLGSSLYKEEGLDAGISACAGVSHRVAEDIKVFATLGRSVGYPTLMDRSWPRFSAAFNDTVADYMEQGNSELRAQESVTADIGTDLRGGNFQVSAYLFASRISDFIFWSNIDTSVYFGHFQPVNSEARIWGANLDLRLEFFDHVSSYVSYCFKKSKDSDRKARLPFSPEHSLFTYLQLEDEFLKKEIGVKLRFETNISSERFMDEYEQDKERGVAILNGKTTIRFLDFHFYYIVRNITDEVYRSMGDYHMPGRSFWWGFWWEFFD
ncbi:MAG: TonB-dependent receptor [Candidatus Zixiibacteriota bacterium]|nr:MAG: TonB-dependent receptor [candidate division Zixibacteria bacterium]